jgi:protein transport protein SEC24
LPTVQLVLPEGFTLLPLFLLAMFKSKPLKPSPVASDVRVYHRRLVQSSSVRALQLYLYPRMFAAHRLADDVGSDMAEGRIVLGEGMRLGYEWMEADGAYLLSESCFLLLETFV